MMTYPEFIEEWRNGDDFITCHTSGSTGVPSEIRLPKREMTRSALRTIRHFDITSSSRLHSCISPDFIGGKMMAVRAETAGCRLTWEHPTNRPDLLPEEGPIDLLSVVPSQMDHILHNLNQYPQIRHILIGGAPIPSALVRKITESEFNAWESYGMTETSSHVALRRVGNGNRFKPFDDIMLSLTPEGCLEIEIEGWKKIVTNDMAELHQDGTFEITGRRDNVIITGGKKVHAEKVEAILEGWLEKEVLITSEPDEKWGEAVVLILDEYSEPAQSDEEILRWTRENLPCEAVPKKIIRGNIPHTSNGKKRRRKSH